MTSPHPRTVSMVDFLQFAAVTVDFSVTEKILGEEGSQVAICLTVSSTLLAFETPLLVSIVTVDTEIAGESFIDLLELIH